MECAHALAMSAVLVTADSSLTQNSLSLPVTQ
jgi:hypothetical protein